MNHITFYKHKNNLKYFQGLLNKIREAHNDHLLEELQEIENSYNQYIQTMESLKDLIKQYDQNCKQWKRDYSVAMRSSKQQIDK